MRAWIVFALGLAPLASLDAAGFSNPFSPRNWALPLPGADTPESVAVERSIPYADTRDPAHRLDFYMPRGKSGFPVVLFIHGGDWRTGDRDRFRGLGNRLARAGVGVAIPSFRLMGLLDNRHPAQVEDVAAAFAWVRKHAAEYGGDASRIYVAGHSSGGHLASLVALDDRYLARHGLSTADIRGVISISGVYSVDHFLTFNAQGPKRQASPIHHVKNHAPPFLVAYCQWDIVSLPKQARQFSEAMRKAGNNVQLLRIPGDNHFSEIFHITQERGPLIDAVLRFVE